VLSIIFHGRKGDTITSRPSWTLDGTFLAFRYLSQLVPEFHMLVSPVLHPAPPSSSPFCLSHVPPRVPMRRQTF